MKRIKITFAVFFLTIFSLFGIITSEESNFPIKFKTAMEFSNGELLIEGRNIFNSSQQNVRIKIFKILPENWILKINNKLYNYSPKKDLLSSLNIFVKKPLKYGPSSFRNINDSDETAEYVIFNHTLVRRVNNGIVEIKTNLSSNKKFVSLTRYKNELYLGTAVNGLYKAEITSQNKFYFKSINDGLPFLPYDQDLKFYEEINYLHATSNGDLIVGIGIKGGVYLRKKGDLSFLRLEWPEKWETADIFLITDSGNTLWVSASRGLLIYNLSTNHYNIIPWKNFNLSIDQFVIESSENSSLKAYYFSDKPQINQQKIKRMKEADNKKLFYTSAYNLNKHKKQIDSLLETNNFNGVVIDVKDDRGEVLYNSSVPFIRQIGALHPVMDLASFIKKVHENGKYVVARIVIFKDPVLFKQQEFDIWNKKDNLPWVGNPKERWVDPYNPDLAKKYYIPMIQELKEMGVNEIQLDYIRFPAEGDLGNCFFRYKTGDKYGSEAIEDFLYQLRESTDLPLGIDIFGYQGLYRTGGYIGQNMEEFGKIVDVISPMLYSSHFGDLYLTDIEKDKRVFRLIEHSIRRAEFISRQEFLIRPYLQAFSMKDNIWGYGQKYFLDQIRASEEEKASGFSFWGNLSNMISVDNAIEKNKSGLK